MPLPPESWMWLGLAFLFVVSFFAGSPVPVPATATVLWLARYDFPVAVVLVATLGSMLGWYFMDGPLRRWLSNFPRLQQKIPVSYQRFFLRQPGLWLLIFNALPFPWDPVRYLALMNHYPRIRLMALLGLGRLIRNTLLVSLGVALSAYQVWFWLAMGILLVLPAFLNYLLEKCMREVKPEEC